jgi:hypothetical protein
MFSVVLYRSDGEPNVTFLIQLGIVTIMTGERHNDVCITLVIPASVTSFAAAALLDESGPPQCGLQLANLPRHAASCDYDNSLTQ